MDNFLQAVTSDFEFIAKKTEFKFNKYSEETVNWENLEKIDVGDIISRTDIQSLSTIVASILNYNIDKMSVSKKIFRLSQLIIDFLLHYKNHTTSIFNEKVKCTALCEFCGKLFIDMKYLKYHCFRRHSLNSCINLNLSENEYVKNLKSEILQLQTNLEKMSTTVQNKSKDSEIYLEENNHNINCNAVHKKKLLYHLIPQSGDNPMQVQEMYWKQKYNSLEKNYNALKNEYEMEQNTIKTNTVLHHKYQQCDLYTNEKSSKYVQTDSLIEKTLLVCSPKQPFQKTDILSEKEICCVNIPDTDKTKAKCHHWNGVESSDKDYSELIKLRQEASMNIIENQTSRDYEYSESLLYSDYVNQIKIILSLEQIQADELFKNTYLIDLITYDVKELVQKRLQEFYNSATETEKYGAILHEQYLSTNRESCEVSDYGNIKIEKHCSPKIDCKLLEKKKKTFMSKLKKTFHINKGSNLDSQNKKPEREPSIKQDLEFSYSSNISDNNDLHI